MAFLRYMGQSIRWKTACPYTTRYATNSSTEILTTKYKKTSSTQRKRMQEIGQMPLRHGETCRFRKDSANEDDSFTGLEVMFLGTSAGSPAIHRGATSIGLRLEGENWLFDCGEGTTRQLKRSRFHSTQTNRIFITHLHGDHIFGIPGLLCSMSSFQNMSDNQNEKDFQVSIYAPFGIFNFLNAALTACNSKLYGLNITIYELIMNNSEKSSITTDINHPTPLSQMHPKIQRQVIVPWKKNNGPLTWSIHEDSNFTVNASTIRHTIPCIGYVVEEKPVVGHIDKDKLIRRGLKPGPLYKELKKGRSVSLPDGSIIYPEEVIGPSRPGRKIVILGDTSDPSGITHLAHDADVVIHEATLIECSRRKAIYRGHSTPEMAGSFAKKIGATSLVLTHFSQKISDFDPNSLSFDPLRSLVEKARKKFGKRSVFAANDFMRIPIPRRLPKAKKE